MKINKWLKINSFFLGNTQKSKKEAETLLSFVIKKPVSWIIGFGENKLHHTHLNKLKDLIKRRLFGEPIDYIIGQCFFWSLSLNISKKSMIPRIDSEVLVRQALKLIPIDKKFDILDLGCGIGPLTLSLASERPNCFFLGVDNIDDLVNLSKKNAKILKIKNVKFIKSNWFSKLKNKNFNIIISNPPYIDIYDPHLIIGDLRFEPLTSLVSKNNGLFDIQFISKYANNYLKKQGWLLFEHGWYQGKYVRNILKKNNFTKIFTKKDYGNNDRITYGKKQY